MRNEIEGVPYNHIFDIYRRYYPQLQTPRFERFTDFSEADSWRNLMGPDVSSISHPVVTHNIVRRFVEYNDQFGFPTTSAEKKLLGTAALVHDLGEIRLRGFGVGDVTFDRKTSDDSKTEREVMERVTAHFKNPHVRKYARRAYDEAVVDRESRLGRMFNAVERIGYMTTALKAFREKKITNWAGLSGNVLSNQIIALTGYAAEYPYVRKFLEDNLADISEALSRISDFAVIPPDSSSKPSFDGQKFENAKRAWDDYVKI